MLVYVDDIIVVSSSPCTVDALLWDLSADFALKDLGPLHYFLEIQVGRTFDGLSLSQEKHAMDLLCHTHVQHCKPDVTPSRPLRNSRCKGVNSSVRQKQQNIVVYCWPVSHSVAIGYIILGQQDVAISPLSNQRALDGGQEDTTFS
jgi:hypothetical protein